jgi:hypothetical protein
MMMRITLDLPEYISKVVRPVAADTRVSFGDAVAELVRRGSRSSGGILPCFALSGSTDRERHFELLA